jgi:putative transposase
MPRPRRVKTGGLVYHTLNRATGRQAIFSTDGDCAAFVRIMLEAYAHIPVEMLAYCIMPTHWHMVLRPHNDGDLSEFMQWVQNTHSHRWKAAHDAMGLGHLYQGRFKSFPVESDGHFLTVPVCGAECPPRRACAEGGGLALGKSLAARQSFRAANRSCAACELAG